MRYELKKIIRIKAVWIVLLVLIVSDLFLLKAFSSEQYTAEVYPKESYQQFLGQIPEQTKAFLLQKEYRAKNTFLYRNLMKTESDYASLTGEGFKEDDYSSLNRYAAYPYHLLFVILFALISAYYLIPAERRGGKFLLLKSTREGHIRLYANKVLTLIVMTSCFSIICDISEAIFIRQKYGPFHRDALLQSLSVFRNCPYDITVFDAMIGMIAVRVLVSAFIGVLVMMLFSSFRRNEFSLAIFAAYSIAEYFFFVKISINSSMNYLTAINPFYQAHTTAMLGNYLNLNILGYPVSQLRASIVILFTAGIACFCIGALSFSIQFQIEEESLIGIIMTRLRQIFSFTWHTSKTGVFETGKVLIHQRKAVILAVYLIVIFSLGRQALSPITFTKADDAVYHKLVHHIQGKVTDRKLSYIESQRAYLDDLITEAHSLGNSTEDRSRALFISFEYEEKNGGLARLESQRDAVMQKGNIPKYFFDEAALEEQFSDINGDIFIFLISGIALVLVLAGIESYDAAMRPLLNTASIGYADIRKKKIRFATVIAVIIFVLWNIPDFLSYFRIDHGKNLMASLSLLTVYDIRYQVSELAFFALLIFLRFVVFTAICILVIKLTGSIKSQAAVTVLGVLAVILISLVCYILRADAVKILLQLFSSGR